MVEGVGGEGDTFMLLYPARRSPRTVDYLDGFVRKNVPAKGCTIKTLIQNVYIVICVC